ncbi:MAG: hypothetical protein Pg6C_04940 [Treponemataceae bacterium]|nr:MAG: hypothetical protein Pg6C_04940 [Treponemataceae bacterium]
MSGNFKALLVFCEGDHDIAYIRTIIRKILRFERLTVVFSQLPYPFSRLFDTSVKNHAADDLSLDMAHKFFLPDEIFKKDNDIILLYKNGGNTKFDDIKTLLKSYLELFEEKTIFDKKNSDYISDYKYLFTFDLDANSLDKLCETLSEKLDKIGERVFISEPWTDTDSNYGKFSGDKAVYVWGDNTGKGTLEDILIPIIKTSATNTALIEKADHAMRDMFAWNFENPKDEERIAEIANFNKSVITTAGQREKSGKSLSVVLKESGLITGDALRASENVNDFINFLSKIMGQSSHVKS